MNFQLKSYLSNNSKLSILITIGKIGVLLALLFVCYDFIWVQNSNPDFSANLLSTFKNSNPIFLILCVLLAPLNWLLESIKWKKLIQSFNPISFSQSWNSIMLGISIGLITPGRVGEYGGRLLHVKPNNISKALFANFIGSVSQNLINIIPGSIALYFFLVMYFQSEITALSICLFFLAFAALLLIIYFNSNNIIPIFSKIKFVKKYTTQFDTFQLTTRELHQVMSLSITRYIIYVSQYVLLLYYFGFDIGFSEIVSSVVIIFLLQSSIPLPPILGVVARTQIAIFVLGIYSQNYTSILSVPVILWIINLLIPSLIGSVILLKSNFNKFFQHV